MDENTTLESKKNVCAENDNMPDFAVTTAFKATDRISPAFDRMGKSADKFSSRASSAFGRINVRMRDIVGGMLGAGLIERGVRGLFGVTEEAIDLASSLVEVQNVVDTTFGGMSKQIDAWSKTTIDAFGLSELQSKQFAGTIGAMGKGAGLGGQALVDMSKDLSGLAGDFASFYNLPIEEAFNKIRSGISGESEPLKQIGKDMSVTGLKAFALSQGISKSYEAMSMAEKYQLRFSYLMSQSKDQMGDFNKTLSTSYANQKRVLSVQFDQFLAGIATRFLPALTEGFKSMNSALKNLDVEKIGRGLESVFSIASKLAIAFLAWKTALIGVQIVQSAIVGIGWITYLASMLPIMAASIKAQGLYNFLLGGTVTQTKLASLWNGILAVKTGLVTASTWAFSAALWANPITWVVAGIMALIAAIALLIIYWNKVKAAVSGFWDMLTGVSSATQDVKTTTDGLGSSFSTAADKLKGFNAAATAAGNAGNQVIAPNAGAYQNSSTFTGEININNAPQGTTVSSKTKGAPPIRMNLLGVNP